MYLQHAFEFLGIYGWEISSFSHNYIKWSLRCIHMCTIYKYICIRIVGPAFNYSKIEMMAILVRCVVLYPRINCIRCKSFNLKRFLLLRWIIPITQCSTASLYRYAYIDIYAMLMGKDTCDSKESADFTWELGSWVNEKAIQDNSIGPIV